MLLCGAAQQVAGATIQGYCLKCREKREMKDVQQMTLKNGREARQGTCATCGTKITVMGNVTAAAKASQAVVDRIGAAGTPVATYVKTYARIGQPLWDEITVAVAIDRSLVTEELLARMDVDTLPGPSYGQPVVWSAEMAPNSGEREVHIVRAIDVDRFLETFVAQASK